MNISLIIYTIIALALSLVVSLLIALPVLLSPLRKAAQQTPKVRNLVWGVASLLSFSIIYGVFTWGMVTLDYSFNYYYWVGPSSPEYPGISAFMPVPKEFELEPLHSKIMRELWMRTLLPYPYQGKRCLTRQEAACSTLSKYLTERPLKMDWLAMVRGGAGLFSVLATSGLVRRFTWPKPMPARATAMHRP